MALNLNLEYLDLTFYIIVPDTYLVNAAQLTIDQYFGLNETFECKSLHVLLKQRQLHINVKPVWVTQGLVALDSRIISHSV